MKPIGMTGRSMISTICYAAPDAKAGGAAGGTTAAPPGVPADTRGAGSGVGSGFDKFGRDMEALATLWRAQGVVINSLRVSVRDEQARTAAALDQGRNAARTAERMRIFLAVFDEKEGNAATALDAGYAKITEGLGILGELFGTDSPLWAMFDAGRRCLEGARTLLKELSAWKEGEFNAGPVPETTDAVATAAAPEGSPVAVGAVEAPWREAMTTRYALTHFNRMLDAACDKKIPWREHSARGVRFGQVAKVIATIERKCARAHLSATPIKEFRALMGDDTQVFNMQLRLPLVELMRYYLWHFDSKFETARTQDAR